MKRFTKICLHPLTPFVIGSANLLLSQGNIYMVVTGILLIVIGATDMWRPE